MNPSGYHETLIIIGYSMRLMIDKEEFKDGSFSVIYKNVISLKITIIVNQSI